jgi:NADPH2:quinone reductase
VRQDEVVLVLGATGSVGSLAVQIAKLLGAARVVAVGRDPGRLETVAGLGADATLALDGDDFQARLAAAVEGAPPTLVLDLLWGPPLEAATAVAGVGARVVNVGQSAGPTASLLSGNVRGKQLQILGYSNFAVPLEELARGYGDVMGHAVAGRLRLDAEAVSLDRVAEAWLRQANGRDVKLVLVP